MLETEFQQSAVRQSAAAPRNVLNEVLETKFQQLDQIVERVVDFFGLNEVLETKFQQQQEGRQGSSRLRASMKCWKRSSSNRGPRTRGRVRPARLNEVLETKFQQPLMVSVSIHSNRGLNEVLETKFQQQCGGSPSGTWRRGGLNEVLETKFQQRDNWRAYLIHFNPQ